MAKIINTAVPDKGPVYKLIAVEEDGSVRVHYCNRGDLFCLCLCLRKLRMKVRELKEEETKQILAQNADNWKGDGI